ncbi:MAG TPA: hypothetical protein PKE12_02225 [Kiritimatiellia bacterium]|nr:hypothetical protein [Kiritimatiellia bacterium]
MMWWGQRSGGFWTAALLAGFVAFSAQAAVYVVEDFEADPNWVDRDPAEMNVVWNNTFGYLSSGSLEGTFPLQVIPSPETDAMRITGASSGGDYAGNYYTSYPGFEPDTASFTFYFFSEDVLPSDLRFRIGNGTDLFSRSLTAQASLIGSWQQITVDLGYAGWLGGSDAQFSNLFTSVTFIDIQIARSGSDAQSFYVDNFSLNYNLDDPGGGGPGDAVPEPGTTQFLLLGLMFLSSGLRRTVRTAVERGIHSATK